MPASLAGDLRKRVLFSCARGGAAEAGGRGERARAEYAKTKEEHMRVTASGESVEVPEGTTVVQLVERLQVENASYVTVSVGDEFVDPSQQATHVLHDGDVVEFLYFMGGGQGEAPHGHSSGAWGGTR